MDYTVTHLKPYPLVERVPEMIFRYWLFCAGCSLLLSAATAFPKSVRDVGPARISMLEMMHPRIYTACSLALSLLVLVSFAAELWMGVKLYSWWPGLVLCIPVNAVMAVVAAAMRLNPLRALAMGAVIVVIGLAFMNG